MALIEKSPLEKLRAWASRLLTIRLPAVSPFAGKARNVVWRQDERVGNEWTEVVRRPDGLYAFILWRRQQLTAPKIGSWEAELVLHESGLYASQDEAVTAALTHLAQRKA